MPVSWYGHISLRMEIYGEGPFTDINDCSPDPCENGGICSNGVNTFTCACDLGYTGPTCGTAILNGPGPLGLESYFIPDSSLTASSEYNADHGAKRGRLNLARVGNLRGAWSARPTDAKPWIQVDLADIYRITSVATQGRQDENQWITSYRLACSTDGTTFYTVQGISAYPRAVRKIFTGNADRNTIVTNTLPVSQICRYVRLMPVSWYGHISLRMEIYGEGPFTDINDCSPDPCENGGICSNGVNTFTCACDLGYTGPTCGTAILNGPGPLGLESYFIPDSSLTASSEYNADHGAKRGRLNLARVGNLRGAWSARPTDAKPWIQVDLADIYRITSVATQGRQDENQWVTSYRLACSTDGTTFYTVQGISAYPRAVRKIFTGNADRNTIVTNTLPVSQICRYVRLMPVSWYGHISLRMEIYGEGPFTDINDCSPDPCENGGTCSNGVNTFTCACHLGYTGPTCGTAILNGPGPLGLESYFIPDSSLTASSEYSADQGAKRGRLNLGRDGNLKGAWSALIYDRKQWIQVDLLDLYRVTSVATQGRQESNQWVTGYKLACSIDGTNFYTVQDIYRNPVNDRIFIGNDDRNTIVTNTLHVPQICRYVRLMPFTAVGHISLRMEIYGEGPITDINDCSPDPCENGGICSDGVNTFTCACYPGYTGPTCGTAILNGPGPLGLESYFIPDSSLTASSEISADMGANRGRLNLGRDGNLTGAWIARIIDDRNPWIQVDLLDLHRVTSVATQGRQESDQWVTSYKLACSTDGKTFYTVQDISTNPANDRIFIGNDDRNTIVTNTLLVPQICRYVRLMPLTAYGHVCLRMEIYGEGLITDINDCSLDPCENGGICSDGVNTFTCACDPGYTGPTCGTAILNKPGLGLESYVIPDSSLTASSAYRSPESGNFTANKGRLNLAETAWGAETEDTEQWIQVDLLEPYRIIAVATQGNGKTSDKGYREWVTSYKLACRTDDTPFHTVLDINGDDSIFTGNFDKNTIVTNTLSVPQVCRYVRLMPVTWHSYIALRMEIYGEDINDCSLDPCENGGICSDGVNTFTCACDPGYTGPTCGTAILNKPGLGLESYVIPDSSLTASSTYRSPESGNFTANKGRLNLAETAWGAETEDTEQWIQVDLLEPYRIIAVATQGNGKTSDKGYREWVTSYKLACRTDDTPFHTVLDINGDDSIFTGNFDKNTIVTNTLSVPQVCRYVRLMPVTWHSYIALRMEIYGEDINDCSLDPCENGGICSDGVNTFTCACDPGYTGPTCETDINDCSLDPCENGGICSDGVNTFTCACDPGYTGPTCGTDINDCSLDPCENGGICSDGVNTFSCACNPGYTGSTCGTVSHSTGISSGAEVRLAGSGSSANQGRVEVYANGQWGTVCDDLFGQKDANVVCRQLGFPGASGYTKAQTFGAGSGPILMDNTRCVGNETSIMDCLTNPIGVHNCQHSDDVGVICRVAQGSSRGAEVRLAGSGSSANQGRVEVYINEQWGTVCDNLWGINDADVVCRQLGFPGASGVTRDAKTFGAGSGPILLDRVRCVGDETSILDCMKSAIGFHSCLHSDDAGVICDIAERRSMEEMELYYNIEEQVAAEERSNAKKGADFKKKNVLQALSDFLAKLKNK
ncbi:neurogenic locus Notch protein isoform X5 [Strongylocentrotus purpuratus]|uniref:Uncharacterized protein n=1 Tax=Strongylocentrotus purpuratus TaxID=7668 RepID=A0A7M7P2V9_STRPU|nr:neurogenic locus Notch protein isoform X5 [Strongylocentrotus purpuratus]